MTTGSSASSYCRNRAWNRGVCNRLALAPGAEKVKITKNAGDVASCKVVGNVNSRPLGLKATNATLQNQALGLGGNTVFVTGANAVSVAGVAYICP